MLKIDLDLTPGSIYRYQATGRRYRIDCVSRDVRTHQEMVVYQALDSPGQGQHHHCTFQDFSIRFQKVEEQPPQPGPQPDPQPAPAPMKLDLSERGPGF